MLLADAPVTHCQNVCCVSTPVSSPLEDTSLLLLLGNGVTPLAYMVEVCDEDPGFKTLEGMGL